MAFPGNSWALTLRVMGNLWASAKAALSPSSWNWEKLVGSAKNWASFGSVKPVGFHSISVMSVLAGRSCLLRSDSADIAVKQSQRGSCLQ